ncbi:MAG: exo-beta-N-acetylmuramidase NamZ family protein [Gemmatimonadales bacterium]
MHRSLVLLGLCGWSLGCAASGPAGAAAPGSVRPGIEVLLADSMSLVRGRRVGLVTNQSGVDAGGISDVVRLRAAGVGLVALFSPEHGFRGVAEPGEAVASSVDSATGLPIYSLYGRTSAPTPEMLSGIDVMLVDLQDVGARYYTWLFTTIEVMKAAGRSGVDVVVLDRPNPIGGLVQGNVLEPAFITTVGQLAMPMRHGMTLGELARLAATDLSIKVNLTVVPVAGWKRPVPLDRTGLPFIPPSLNLRSLESLYHYPGTCLFEGTNLSVGRGSDAAFQQIGAPWLDTAAVLVWVRNQDLPGVRFYGVTFTPARPGDGKYADTLLYGIRLEMTDRDTYDPTATAVHLLTSLRIHHGGAFAWIPKHFDRLAGTAVLRQAIEGGSDPAVIVRSWGSHLARFNIRRRPFLLYEDGGS